MMYMCEYCGAISEEEGDCGCGGWFEPAMRCPGCLEWHLDSDGGGWCDECLASFVSVDRALNYAAKDEETETIEINAFLATAFDADEIEAILIRELKTYEKQNPSGANELAGRYLMQDKDWFADKIEQELENK